MVYAHLAKNRILTGLLVLGFLAFLTGIAMIFSEVQAGDPLTFAIPTLLFALFYVLISLAFSKNAVLALSHAKKVDHEQAPEIFHLLENLAIARGVPMPELYSIDDTAPNAFACGTFKKKSAVCVTTGLLQKLTKPELEGVLAHELAHIQHEDTRLMTLVVVLVGVVTLLSEFFLRSMFWRGPRRNDRNGGGNAIFIILGIVLALLSPFLAQLLKLAIGRKREFYADAEAALSTRYPEGLASALEKIAADPEKLEAANHATAHLYVHNPFKGKEQLSFWNRLFSTHPPAEERVRRLREMMT